MTKDSAHESAAPPRVKKKPKRDVGPTKESTRTQADKVLARREKNAQTSAAAAIIATPHDDNAMIMIGERRRYGFRLEGAKPKSSMVWLHSVRGPHGTQTGTQTKGRTSAFTVSPVHLGDHQLHSAVLDGEDLVAQRDASFTTPQPMLMLEQMFSTFEDRRVPVLDTFQIKEALHVIVELLGLGADPAVAQIRAQCTDSNLTTKQVKALGDRRFEVILRPQQVGGVNGKLHVSAFGLPLGHAPAIQLRLQVKPMQDRHDYGGNTVDDQGRPFNTADAASHYDRELSGVFERQKDAVRDVIGNEKEVDPTAPDPAWKSILISVSKIALGTVTAGIGVAIAEKLVGASGEAAKEMVKVFSEQTIYTAIAASESGLDMKSPDKGLDRATLRGKFKDLQLETLSKAATATVGGQTTRALSIASELDRRSPGAGVRYFMEITAAARSQFVAAHQQQYSATFQAWCSLLARTATHRQAKVGAEATPLDGMVQADRLRDTTVIAILPADQSTVKSVIKHSGVDVVAGILRLDLENMIQPELVHGPLRIVRAVLGGFTNQALRDEVTKKPVHELKIPIVVSYRGGGKGDKGWVFGRDEQGRITISSNSRFLTERSKTGKAEDAAAGILIQLGTSPSPKEA